MSFSGTIYGNTWFAERKRMSSKKQFMSVALLNKQKAVLAWFDFEEKKFFKEKHGYSLIHKSLLAINHEERDLWDRFFISSEASVYANYVDDSAEYVGIRQGCKPFKLTQRNKFIQTLGFNQW